MRSRRVRHGLALAAVAIAGAAVVAAVLYGMFAVALSLYRQRWEL